MTERLDIYKCKICGNIVQILIEGEGTLVCCGHDMEKQEIQYDTNELGEKHSPKVKEQDGKTFVHVNTHPMNEEHYIQFIQGRTKDKRTIKTQYFYPNEIPQMDITEFNEDIYAIEYCNIHHLWGM